MELTTILFIGGAVVAVYLAHKFEQRRDEKRDIQFELRYPTLDETEPGAGDTFNSRT